MAQGTCPVCNGTGVVTASNGRTDECRNCGGQKMFGTPTGMVNLREDGTPCKHQYERSEIGRCLTKYVCIHCKDSYTIDSGG